MTTTTREWKRYLKNVARISSAPEAIPYDRRSFLVQSMTRRDVFHLVDFEGFGEDDVVCTCEAFNLGKERPCRHIKAATIPLL